MLVACTYHRDWGVPSVYLGPSRVVQALSCRCIVVTASPLQVRWDPKKYPYLNRGDQFAWQDCGEKCWNDLSSRYNVQGGPINVWVAGSFEGAFKCTPLATLCQLSANGLTTSNPGANDQFRPGGEDSPTQVGRPGPRAICCRCCGSHRTLCAAAQACGWQ